MTAGIGLMFEVVPILGRAACTQGALIQIQWIRDGAGRNRTHAPLLFRTPTHSE